MTGGPSEMCMGQIKQHRMPAEGTLVPSKDSLPGGSEAKGSAFKTGDLGSIPGWGRSPGGEHGNPLQYSCLKIPMDRGGWQTIVHRVAQSRARLEAIQHSTAQQALLREYILFGNTLAFTQILQLLTI